MQVLAVLTQDGQFRALKQLSKRKIIQKKIIHVLKREKQILVRSQVRFFDLQEPRLDGLPGPKVC